MTAQKIPGDRLVLATISVLRTLIHELSARGIMDQAEFATKPQTIAIAHRESGDPNNLAVSKVPHGRKNFIETSVW